MKKIILVISILLIASLLFIFQFKPSDDNQRKMVNIGKINLQNFDLYDVLEKVTDDNRENLNLFFEDFTMTVTDKNNVVSLNFSFIEDQGFRDKKTNVHLYGINDKLIVKSELLDEGKDFSIKEYIFSIFNIGNTGSQHSPFYVQNYMHQDDLSDLLTNLNQTFIDDINTEKDRLHIELLPRANYTIYNNDMEIYIVNTVTGNITTVENLSNDNNIQPVYEGDIIKSYKVNNLRGLCSYTGSAGKLKYYFLEEN